MDNLIIKYINLDKRPDKKEYIIGQFEKLGVKNYERFPAITHSFGGIGCAQSHKKILDDFVDNNPNNKLLMVAEDDATFLVSKVILDKLINDFSKSNADILCLGFDSYAEMDYSGLFKRTINTTTSTCYVIKKEFAKLLAINISEGIKIMEQSINNYHIGAIDQYWKKLQTTNVFLIPKIRAVKQLPSYSDIVNKFVDRGV